jgi:hypothetical protein
LSPQAVFTTGMTYPKQIASVNVQGNANENISSGLNGYPAAYYGYGLQTITGAPLPVPGNQIQPFSPQASFAPYGSSGYQAYPRFTEGPRTTSQNRRSGEADSSPFSRFSNVPLETYRGEFYGLCKDQHGCRYLQRKLEERNPESVQMIFLETNMHVVELMTGLFLPSSSLSLVVVDWFTDTFVGQIHSAIISARSCLSIPMMSSALL